MSFRRERRAEVKVVVGPLLLLLLRTQQAIALELNHKHNLGKMTLKLAKMRHTRILILVIVMVLDLIVLMILIDHQVFGIVVVNECSEGDPLVISFRLHLILHIPLMIGIFLMVPHHHLLLMAIQIIIGAVLLVGVVLGHLEVVPRQAGWRGAEGDITMVPHVGEEELYQDPLHLIGTSLWISWIWSKMVNKIMNICFCVLCFHLFLSLFWINFRTTSPSPSSPVSWPPTSRYVPSWTWASPS